MNLKPVLPTILLSALIFASCKKDDTITPAPTDPAPVITGISPTSGPKNTVVTITGTDFGVNLSTLKVYFNGVQATVQTATATQITVLVPANAGTGIVKVEKTPALIANGPAFTYTGSGWTSTLSVSGPATALNHPSGIAKDAGGNLYVCDRDNNRIVKITPAGVTSVFAGSGTAGFTDGTGTAAQFNQPYCIVADGSGNFYVGDRLNNAIRKITPAAVVTTLAGNGSAGSTDGTGSAASFTEPLGIAVTSTGNLYVADYGNQKIRKVTLAGVVTTAVSGYMSFGIVADAANVIYFTNYFQNRVFKFTEGSATPVLVAGDINPGTADGTGAAARFTVPAGITVDGTGNLYITETSGNRIRKITPAGVVTTLSGSTAGYADGANALFDSPIALTGDYSNNLLYIADFNNNKIRKMIIE
ncbi:MAG: IPT/TIG domain-containing protein [Chitinophagaceae bacterium]